MSRLPHEFHFTAIRRAIGHLLPALIPLLTACHSTGGTYQDRDKWMLTDRMTRMTLRGQPKQVTEYIYPASDTARPEKRKIYYTRYGFDAGGNIISRHAYMDDTLWMTFDYWVNSDGLQDSTKVINGGKVIHSDSRRLSDGRYLTVDRHGYGKPTASILSFLAGGDEKIREYYPDSTAQGKPRQVAHFYYQGSRLMRVAAQTKEGPEEVRYFYSAWDAPDSIWTYKDNLIGRTLIERELFFHNKQGDVVRDITIRGSDTTRLEDNSYSYDAKGNWVRQISFERKGRNPYDTGNGVTVTDREFLY
jgi:hypothetical protein